MCQVSRKDLAYTLLVLDFPLEVLRLDDGAQAALDSLTTKHPVQGYRRVHWLPEKQVHSHKNLNIRRVLLVFTAMAATSQLTRPSVETSTTVTEAQSLKVVQNILDTSIGSILYLRGLFDDNNFATRQFAGVSVSLLRSPGDTGAAAAMDDQARQMRELIHNGVFDALQKRYLKKLVLSVFSSPESVDAEKTLLESFEYRVSYGTEGSASIETFSVQAKTGVSGSTANFTKEAIASQAKVMLRSIVQMCGVLPTLPVEKEITIKLYYTDETPDEYQPLGFGDSTGSALDRLWQDKPLKVRVGAVRTGHHSMRVRCATAEEIAAEAVELKEDDLLAGMILKARAQQGDVDAEATAAGEAAAPSTRPESNLDRVRDHVLATGNARIIATSDALGLDRAETRRLLSQLQREGVLRKSSGSYEVVCAKKPTPHSRKARTTRKPKASPAEPKRSAPEPKDAPEQAKVVETPRTTAADATPRGRAGGSAGDRPPPAAPHRGRGASPDASSQARLLVARGIKHILVTMKGTTHVTASSLADGMNLDKSQAAVLLQTLAKESYKVVSSSSSGNLGRKIITDNAARLLPLCNAILSGSVARKRPITATEPKRPGSTRREAHYSSVGRTSDSQEDMKPAKRPRRREDSDDSSSTASHGAAHGSGQAAVHVYGHARRRQLRLSEAGDVDFDDLYD